MTATSTTDSSPTTRLGSTAVVALGLGIASALLITVVSFLALVLAAAALITGGTAIGRGDRRAAPLTGMLLALGAIALFVVEVSG